MAVSGLTTKRECLERRKCVSLIFWEVFNKARFTVTKNIKRPFFYPEQAQLLCFWDTDLSVLFL